MVILESLLDHRQRTIIVRHAFNRSNVSAVGFGNKRIIHESWLRKQIAATDCRMIEDAGWCGVQSFARAKHCLQRLIIRQPMLSANLDQRFQGQATVPYQFFRIRERHHIIIW